MAPKLFCLVHLLMAVELVGINSNSLDHHLPRHLSLDPRNNHFCTSVNVTYILGNKNTGPHFGRDLDLAPFEVNRFN